MKNLLLSCLLLWTIAALTPIAHGQPDSAVEIERLTWTEIATKLAHGTRTVIIPVGGTEQSGPYIAVGKHNVRAKFLATAIARELGHTLVAPVICYVPEGGLTPLSSHMRFPGTITIPPAVFSQLVESAAQSFAAHGFNNIILLGDHGGYQPLLRKAAERLNHKWRTGPAHTYYIPQYYTAVQKDFNAELRRRGLGASIGTHADINDTSLMMAVDPSMVRAEALRQAPKPTAADGVYGGDPRRATPELGQLGIKAQISAAVAAIRHNLNPS